MCPFTKEECKSNCKLCENKECAITIISRSLSQLVAFNISKPNDMQKIIKYLKAIAMHDVIYDASDEE